MFFSIKKKKKKEISGQHGVTKILVGDGVSYTDPRKIRFGNAVPCSVLLRKNFRTAFRYLPSQKYHRLYIFNSVIDLLYA